MDLTDRARVRKEEKDCKVLEVNGRDSRANDSNGTYLLRFAGGNRLAPLNTFFPSPRKVCLFHVRHGQRRLVRNVHFQPSNSPDTDHNVVCASVRLLRRSACNRPWRTPIGHKPIDRQALASDTNGRDQHTQLIVSELRQNRTGDIVNALATKFADMILSSAEEVVPRQTRKPRIQG